ncbi:MAG TPA: histidine phosphatase family protein [Chloroflexota bacterium]|nr:histidine phosphatase family protein [Chloroflexota bacterium]
MLLHVVRHAESLGNVSRSSAIDCDLSDLGRAQAQALAVELKRLGVDRVLSSPYRRTLCTAQAVAEATAAPLEVYPLLHEHHPTVFPPEWPLMTRSELVVNFPGVILPDDLADQGWCTPPETDALVFERMCRALADLEQRYANQRLVLVTHGSPAGKLVQAFLGTPDPTKVEVTIANASITTLESTGWRRYVRGVNRTDHLRDVVAPPSIVEAVPVTTYL